MSKSVSELGIDSKNTSLSQECAQCYKVNEWMRQ